MRYPGGEENQYPAVGDWVVVSSGATPEEHSTRLYEKMKWKKIAKWSKELKNRP